ncbi:MAG: DUF2231 domain-containing protein [Actinobacteria bacterium]|nr:DUF2231 domain-containing protein [Actinomycetota bacterium]
MRTSIERLEQLGAIDPVSRWARSRLAPLREGRAGDVLTGQWLGHAVHPMLTDLPIGCWTSSALLDVVGGARSRHASTRLVALGIAAVPLTAATGMADWSNVGDRRAQRVGLVHGVGNLVATACYVQSWRRRRQGHHLHGVAWGLVGGTCASVTGYLGGHLSFNLGTGIGDRGLRESAPSPSHGAHEATSNASDATAAAADRVPVDSWEGLD